MSPKRLDRRLHLDDALVENAVLLAFDIARLRALNCIESDLGDRLPLLELGDLARKLADLLLELLFLLDAERDVVVPHRTADAILAALLLDLLAVALADLLAAVRAMSLAVRLVRPVAADRKSVV